MRADRGTSIARPEFSLAISIGSSVPRRYSIISRCAFVPPKPNEFTPAIAGPESSGHRSRQRGTRNCRSSKGILGFGLRKCRFGGIIRRLSDKATLITPAMPAAASKCPILVFTDPIRLYLPLGRPDDSTFPMAAASIGSPIAVPVPCASR